jgi:hypothetical protein
VQTHIRQIDPMKARNSNREIVRSSIFRSSRNYTCGAVQAQTNGQGAAANRKMVRRYAANRADRAAKRLALCRAAKVRRYGNWAMLCRLQHNDGRLIHNTLSWERGCGGKVRLRYKDRNSYGQTDSTARELDAQAGQEFFS